MRYPKWFARWRLQVWDNRLADARKEWNRAEVANQPDGVLFWERRVTRALVKRVKWLKRAGVRLATGGPVRRGQPYIVGDACTCDNVGTWGWLHREACPLYKDRS